MSLLISDVLRRTPTYGRAKAGRPARTYILQLCVDTGCSLEDLPEAMNDREKWRKRVRNIYASGTTWWWWWWMDLCFNLFLDIRNDALVNLQWPFSHVFGRRFFTFLLLGGKFLPYHKHFHLWGKELVALLATQNHKGKLRFEFKDFHLD